MVDLSSDIGIRQLRAGLDKRLIEYVGLDIIRVAWLYAIGLAAAGVLMGIINVGRCG